jgi:hypothetical protein
VARSESEWRRFWKWPHNIYFGASLGGSQLDTDTLALTNYHYDPRTNFFVEAIPMI